MKKYKFSLICATCLVTLTSLGWGSGQGGDVPTDLGFFGSIGQRLGGFFGGNNQPLQNQQQNLPRLPQVQQVQGPQEEVGLQGNHKKPQNLTQIYQEESSDEGNQGGLNSRYNGSQIRCETSSDEESETQLFEAKKQRGRLPQREEGKEQDSDEEMLIPCSQGEFRKGSDEIHLTDFGQFLVWRDQNTQEEALGQQQTVLSPSSLERKKEDEGENRQEEVLSQQQPTLSQPPFGKKKEEEQGGEPIKSPKKKKVKKEGDEPSQQEVTAFLQQIYPQLFLHQQFPSQEPESNNNLTPQEKMRMLIKKAQEERQKQGGLIQKKKKKK